MVSLFVVSFNKGIRDFSCPSIGMHGVEVWNFVFPFLFSCFFFFFFPLSLSFFTFNQFYVLPSSFSLSFLFFFSFFFSVFVCVCLLFFGGGGGGGVGLSLFLGILYIVKGIIYKTFSLLNVFLFVMQFFISTCCDVPQLDFLSKIRCRLLTVSVFLTILIHIFATKIM